MPRKLMWMGPRGHERWVPTPKSGTGPFAPVGYASKSQYFNGGVSVRTSRGAHMEYNLEWNRLKRDEFRPIMDMYFGKYGPGLIYWTDPMVMAYNAVPYSWSWLAGACYDDPPIVGNVRPTLEATSASAYDYPVESAGYSLSPTMTSRSLYLPIPPGYTAWVGMHGQTDAGEVLRVRPMNGYAQSDDTQMLPTLGVDTNQRFSHSFDRGNSQSQNTGIEIDFFSSTTRNVVLTGVMVQYVLTGRQKTTGDFISGGGHSGCEFEQAPSSVPISDPLDLIEPSAKLVETGTWR